MSDHYDQWADKQRAMGRRVPPTSAPYFAPKTGPSTELDPGMMILSTDPEFTLMATHFKVRCNRCEIAFTSNNIVSCRFWRDDHECDVEEKK